MSVTLLYPIAGWLAVLLPLLWWPMRARPRWRHLGLRIAVFACLILALMQPSLVRRAGAGVQVFVLDQRAVLGADGQAAARRALARVLATAPTGARRVLIALGEGAAPPGFATRQVVTTGSLSTALDDARDAIPLGTGGTVTLIADPRSTDRHWDEALTALAARRIPVDTIALTGAPQPAFIGDVQVAPARVGEAIRVDTTVEGDGVEGGATHRLTITSEGRPLASSAPFRADGATRVALEVPATRAGFLPLRVTLDGRGGVDTLAAVQDPVRLLYLGERQAGAAPLLQRLLGPGFAVDPRPPAALAGAVDPARWPLVMLDDVPAARLPVAAQQRLTRAVARAGTGLFASGGFAAFGPGGYADTPLGAALPVTPRGEDKRIRPSVALAIVIDSSGSMQGDRLDLAKQVARQTVRKLTANDWVGVVEFYGARQWSVPMHHVTDGPDVERAIGRMQAQGASVLFPALQEAFYGLKDLDARYRHILVISDGGVAEDRYQQLIRHIADNRINVSTVAVGGKVDDEKSMADWARIGRGRFYSVPDEFSLVDLDFKQPETRPDPGYRSGNVVVKAVQGSRWWAGLRMAGLPPLSGYVPTRARPEAETLIATRAGDPILSTWPVGAGRVTALTTEPFGAGTAGWRGWPDYGRWLARVLGLTARARPDMVVTLDRRFDRLSIAVQRLGAASADAARRMPAIVLLDGAGRPIRRIDDVEERAPGLFVADTPLSSAEPARVEVRDGGSVGRAADAAASDIRPESAMPSSFALPLADLSQRTGGWHRDDAGAAFGAVQATRGWRATDLWPWLALLALGLYLLDIGYRRWPARRFAGFR
ncbi:MULTISPECIES: vWA domain-containing protein [unclassified Sphingomonas]|uniref:vWA domain-containing protein n=1 Tax=unclassified Sphingomonas TaxID=196159 RepID=UPI000E1C04B6|nr:MULTISPECIES: vWA domain-containing protein [unclassified Sphingomonas]